MVTKTDLYREVLAIEPNSKVFFPLAKELAGQGRSDEAVDVLRKGVVAHPDHLEARFLLVELLSRLDRAEEAAQAFSGVGAMLAAYPAVWALWAESAASSSLDSSLALRFLARFFREGGLTWAEVLENGLRAAPAGPASAALVETPETSESASVQTAGPTLGETADLAPEKAESPAAAPREAALEDISPEAASPEEEEPALTLRGAHEVRELAGLFEEEALAEPEAVVEPEAVSPIESRRDEEVVSSQVPAGEIRTLTMAALLARQGETRAALGIYRELSRKAKTEEERRRISVEIDALERGETDDVQTAEAAAEAAPTLAAKPKGANRLVSLLESLAARLEARVGA